MILFKDLTEKANDLELLQKANHLDDEVRLIKISGYKSDLNNYSKERFILKPFMLRELFQMVERNYRTVSR